MNLKKLTAWFILVAVLVIAVYDGYVLIEGGTEASISHTLYMWSHKYPLVTFLWGMLCGHLFWRIRDTKETRKLNDAMRDL